MNTTLIFIIEQHSVDFDHFRNCKQVYIYIYHKYLHELKK